MASNPCLLVTSLEPETYASPRLVGHATTSDSLIFGSDGLELYLSQSGNVDDIKDGRFFGVLPKKSSVTIRTDRTGQEQLFYFNNRTFWAVSNSFLMLAKYISKFEKISLYHPALIGFHLKNGGHVGEQLVSHKTPVEQISMVPATTDIVVDKQSGEASLARHDFEDEFSLNGQSYENTLVDFLELRSGVARALADTGASTNLYLSGGYDSRLVLALYLQGAGKENLRLTSDTSKSNDFASAEKLAKAHDLPLNVKGQSNPVRASTSDAIRLWLMSCGCTYLPFYRLPQINAEDDYQFRLTGDRPTGREYFSGNGLFNGSPTKIAKDMDKALDERPFGSEVSKDFVGVLSDIGIDQDHPKSMLAHYWAIRSRHHCGRNWYKSLGKERLVTLLMDSAMVKLDFYSGCQGWPHKKFFADCFSALGKWALEIPFETPDRNFEPELLESSPFKGGAEIKPRNIKVFGRPVNDDVSSSVSMSDLPVSWRADNDGVKDQLAHNFWNAERARDCECFSQDDFNRAKAEIDAQGRLSTSFRKVSHIVMSESLLEIIEGSNSRSVTALNPPKPQSLLGRLLRA